MEMNKRYFIGAVFIYCVVNLVFAGPYDITEKGGRICRDLDIRNKIDSFEKLKGCRVIEGFLQVLLLNVSDTLVFPDLVEVTEYVLFYRVTGLKSLGQLFPNLTVIRGNSLFHNYALVIYENPQLEDVGLYGLRVITRGAVRIEKNELLCFADTVNWNIIAKGEHFIKNNNERSKCPTRKVCSQCDEAACWSLGKCQLLKNVQYRKCHESCLGGCVNGTGPHDCIVCKEIFVDGLCTDKCPTDRFSYMGRRCITKEQCQQIPKSEINQHKECDLVPPKAKKWIAFNGVCAQSCPVGYQEKDGVGCESCQGHCQKYCGEGNMLNVTSIACVQSLKGCTHINGSLSFHLLHTEANLQNELTENLQNIEEIEGFLKVTRSNSLTSLNFLKGLKIIHGKVLERNKYALVVGENQNLEQLWNWESLNHSLQIIKGRFHFHDNPKLCVQVINKLGNVSRLSNFTDIEVSPKSNGNRAICRSLTLNTSINVLNSTTVLVKWDSVNSSKGSLLGYTIHYIEAGNSNVSRLYEDSCDEDRWLVDYIMVDDEYRQKEMTHIIGSLKPFTRYAYFVETFSRVSAAEGGQSVIDYFQTFPDRPYIPRSVSGYSISSSEIYLEWEPPAFRNGRITHYLVFGKWYSDENSSVVDRNFCLNPPVPRLKENTVRFTSMHNENVSCACEPKKLCANGEEFSHFSFIFSEGSAQLDDELCEQPNTLYTVLYSNRLYGNGGGIDNYRFEAMFNESIIDFFRSSNPVGYNFTDNTIGINLNGSYSHFSKRIDANSAKTTIRNLRHFSDYSIKIIACRAPYENESNDSWFEIRCGPAAVLHVRTEKLSTADDINSTTFFVNDTYKMEERSVNLVWNNPENPNGIIIKYELQYSREDLNHSIPVTLCVPRAGTDKARGNFTLKSLPYGNYSARVRAWSLAGPGSFTEAVIFKVTPPVTRADQVRPLSLTATLSGVGIFVLFIITASGFTWWVIRKERKRQRLLVTTANPEYISIGSYVEDEWEVVRDKVEIIKELSQGSFGMVYEGLLRPANVRCAVKTVNEKASVRERLEFLNEASIMKSFAGAHHVVKLLGVVSRGQPPLVVMELMTKGDLKNFLRAARDDPSICPDIARIIRISAEIADGMAYLEASKFVHRDLAARNCMISEDMTVKIGDFGMARDVYDFDYYRKENRGLVPVRWMSPESLKDGVFTSQSDVWSYGVVLWEIVTLAEQPYQGLSNEEVLRFVIDGGQLTPPLLSPGILCRLMSCCWRRNPTHRPTFLQILDCFESFSDTYKLPDDFRLVSFYHSDDRAEIRSRIDIWSHEEELVHLIPNSDSSSNSGYFQP